ncbi:MAG: fumarate reductase cytochrome b subunit [Desulfobacula sp.]|uniref:fumarate reductase cytochrome b subunit n=1 Tax=Desulfobacula sp. TaxID=2593537 RepID=UPI0025BB31B3|nr:fumarate reductase cytochrome b subunit [Desulfobacula sp.]MCD4720941.1 fumarate reductase cytochrome b subunit [Desulfobacula sp.]
MDSYIIESIKKNSRIPARLDFLQSGTGLILGLFMWVHMLLVASIILGKGSFNFVARTMELAFLSDTGQGFPIAVFFAVFIVFTLFIIHALLGVRKFPISWKQHRIITDQMQMMNHSDTNLWYIQVVTGFIMFFAGSVHLYVMLTHPGSIDPYLSADRIISGNMWPLYLILLICVELHGTIGLYRLCMKWGWFSGKDARKSRKTLKALKNRLTIFFLTIGVLALLVFVVIGINHRDKVGERYNKHEPAVEQVRAEEVIQAEEQVPVEEQAQIEEHVQADEEIPAEGHEPEEAQPADVTHQ